MRSVTIKVLALLLAALMILPMLAACGDTGETTDTTAGAETEATTEKQPAVAKKDYDEEFTVIYRFHAIYNDRCAKNSNKLVRDILKVSAGFSSGKYDC